MVPTRQITANTNGAISVDIIVFWTAINGCTKCSAQSFAGVVAQFIDHQSRSLSLSLVFRSDFPFREKERGKETEKRKYNATLSLPLLLAYCVASSSSLLSVSLWKMIDEDERRSQLFQRH